MKKIILIISFITVRIFASSELYYKAFDFYNKGNFNEAYNLFCKIDLTSNADLEKVASIKYYKADCLLKSNMVDAAISEYEDYVRTSRYSFFYEEALYKLGTVYFNLKQYEKARLKFKEIPASKKYFDNLGTSYYLVGQSYFLEKKYDSAVVYLQKALENRKTNKYIPNTYYSIAYSYELSGLNNDAVKFYDQLLTFYRNSDLAASAQIRIGVCYYNLKDFDNSIVELKDTLIYKLPKKTQIEAFYVMGNAYYQLKEFENSVQTLQNTLKVFPGNYLSKEIRYTLAWSYFQQKKYNDAFKLFNLLSKYNDTISSNALFWSGECKKYDNKFSEALSYYETYLEHYPAGEYVEESQIQIATIKMVKKEYKASSDVLIQLLNAGKKESRAKALVLLGELHAQQKKFNIAKNYFDAAIKMSEIETNIKNRALLGSAVCAYQNSQYDAGATYLQELYSKYPNFEKDMVSFYLAEIFFAKGDYNSALKFYGNVNDKNFQPDVTYGRAYCYYNLKDYENSRYQFEDYLKKNSSTDKTIDAQLRLADCFYATRKYTEANNIYSEVFNKKSGNLNDDYTYYQYAQSLYRAGNFQAAIEEFDKFQKKFPKSEYIDESMYLVGWIYSQKAEYTKAIQSYEKVLAKYNESTIIPIVLNSVGDCYYNLENYDTSASYYKRVLDKFPGSSYALNAAGGIIYAFTAKNNVSTGTQIIKNFLAANPLLSNKEQIAIKVPEAFYNSGDYEQAYKEYGVFVDSFKNCSLVSNALYWKAKSAIALKNIDDAKIYLKVVVDTFMSTEFGIDAAVELGKLYHKDKDFDTEIKIYDKAIAHMPDNEKIAEIVYKKGQALLSKGDISEATATFNDIIIYYDQSPFVANAKYELALLEMSRKNYNSSDKLLRELSTGQTDDVGVKAQFNLGISLMEQSKYNDAISAFVRIINVFTEFDDWVTRSYMKLGECYVSLSDIQKARDMYQKVVSRNTNDEYTKEAQKKLKQLK